MRSGALVLGVLCAALAACGPRSSTGPCELQQEIRICADAATLKGIDVSYFQGTVDWTKVKNAGTDFAFARISDGLSTSENKFGVNWPGMKAAGLVRGSYQYFRASKDPVAQADLVITALMNNGGLELTDLPPVLDFEELDGVSSANAVIAAKAWIARIEDQLKRKPIIYSGNNMATTTMMNFSAYPLWVPNYTTMCPLVPDGWTHWDFWQNSASGHVDGVGDGTTTDVDTNFFNGDMTKLAAFIVSTNLAPPPVVDMSMNPTPRDLSTPITDPPDMAFAPCGT